MRSDIDSWRSTYPDIRASKRAVTLREHLSATISGNWSFLTALDDKGDDQETDEDARSAESDSTDEDIAESIGFCLNMLMELVPSMEKLYDQNANQPLVQPLERSENDSVVSLKGKETATTARLVQGFTTGSRQAGRPSQAVADVVRIQSHDWRRKTSATGRTLHEDFDFHANDLGQQFKHMLRTRRLNELQERARSKNKPTESSALSSPPSSSAPPTATPPAYSDEQPQAIIPCPPRNASELKFRNLLLTLSSTPIRYENPGLLNEALTYVPLDVIYKEADEEHSIMKSLAASIGDNVKTEWGYQDCLTRSLLRWFKRSFFTYVNNPLCSICGSVTRALGYTPLTPEEQACEAFKVELYICSDTNFSTYERFPRYQDPWQLLQTRRGQVGEFANCFTMLCRAFGARARWVWNSEDGVWTEIYSEHQNRWIHVDPCEELWDDPSVYTEGWNRKLAYCIAFSIDGATDVTQRYVRTPSIYSSPRLRCREETLVWIMHEIRKIRREKLDKESRQRLIKEDDREERELRSYVAQRLVQALVDESLSGQLATADPIKEAERAHDRALAQAEAARAQEDAH